MSGFADIGPIFGVFFAIAGLALAVVLGMALYKDDKPERASTKDSLKLHEEGTSA
jgi:hypothetical protein